MKNLLILVAAMVGASAQAATPAPLVLFNTTVYTANDKQPRAEAVIAENGRITFVGSTADALMRAPAGAQRLDLKGRTVLPGLTDAHAHLSGIGFRELEFDLEGTASVAELQARLKTRSAQTKPGDWLTGRGWIESRWTPAVFPTRQDLDAVVADRAVVLRRSDGHSLVANSLALKRAGIDRNTRDPAGGKILRDAATGEPTGLLVDDAMELVNRLIPPHFEDDILKAVETGAHRSERLGWTQLQIAGNSWQEMEIICRLHRGGRIKLRLYDAINGPGADAERLLKQGARINDCGGRLTVRGIKVYIDGALGSRGAALLEPYSDSPGNTGLLVNSEQTLYPLLTQALKRGIQIETHAIGDRGNRIMLDLYEKAFNEVPSQSRLVPEPRWRIEHAQVLSLADIPRFAKLHVIASMQPSHAIGDMFFAPQRLGPARLAGAYAWRSLLDSGAVIAAGTDAPVEKGDPRVEFYAAVTRRSIDGIANDDWHLEQRVSRDEALRMMTRAPAYAAFQENERGSIEVGKQADFSVFSADFMTIPEPQILKSSAVLTVIAGEIVYSAL